MCPGYTQTDRKTDRRRALFVSILAWKTFDHIYIENLTLWPGDVLTSQGDVTWRHAVTSYELVTSHRDVIWRRVKWQSESAQVHPLETPKIRLCDLVTLTFDPWPWPLSLAEIISRSFATPNFVTLGQTVQSWERWLTDTQTHRQTGPIPYPRQLTREGKNKPINNYCPYLATYCNMHYLLQRRDEEAFHYVFSLCIYQSRSWYILVIDDKDLLQRKRALNTSENKMCGFKLKIGPSWTKPLKLIPRFVAVHWTYIENEKGNQP